MDKETTSKLAKRIHQTAKDKGWWDKERNEREMFMLMVTELAEAVEAHRDDHWADVENFNSDNAFPDNFRPAFEKNLKGTVEVELADAFIRCLDFMEYHSIPPEEPNMNAVYPENFAENMLGFSHLACVGMIPTMARNISQFAEELGINFLWFVEQKMRYNDGREKMHGGKKY